MVRYYCEFCNQNLELSKKKRKAVCVNCEHFLIENSIDQEEIQKREKIRIGYCPKCEKDQYGVPLNVMRNDIIMKIKTRKFSYLFYCSLIWVIVFIIGLIGASPYSVDTYNTLETYYTTLIILISFLGVLSLIALIFYIKKGSNKKEIEQVESLVDNLNSKGHKLVCSKCLEPFVLK
ncbi:MAG: hypothetical protein ACFE9Q_10935 [Candidatus Hodarchaeota archaeon]